MIGRRVVYTLEGRLEIWETEVPPPEPGGLLVRVSMGGVCGTDYRILTGDIPLPFTVTMGHEGVGTVEALGLRGGMATDRAGETLHVGDRVYWCPRRPCQRCYYCSVEKDMSSCLSPSWPEPATSLGLASLAEFAWLGADAHAYRIPDDTPSDAVIALGCALPSVLQAVDKLGPISSTDSVVIQGCGPVGIAATFVARIAGAKQIIVIGAPEDRLAFASRFGATHTVGLEEPISNRVAQIQELCGGKGADVVIEAADQTSAFEQVMRLLARNGRYLVVGPWTGAGTVELDMHYLNNNHLRIIGSQFSEPHHYHRTVRLVQRWKDTYPFPEAITHRFPLADSTAAIEAAGLGEPIKAVVTP